MLISLSSREWRNWQTRWLQVPVLERAWGFKSPLAHERVVLGIAEAGSWNRPSELRKGRVDVMSGRPFCVCVCVGVVGRAHVAACWRVGWWFARMLRPCAHGAPYAPAHNMRATAQDRPCADVAAAICMKTDRKCNLFGTAGHHWL
jgi:hypothetical protein